MALRAWHDSGVSVLMVVAAAAILGGVVVVAMGWGGELGPAGRDSSPVRPGSLRSPEEIATFRPPAGLFGYQQQPVRDGLWQIAGVLAERDAQIAALRAELAQLRPAARKAEIAAIGAEQPEARQQDGPAAAGPDAPQ
jgi:hypothetical protein